MSDYLQPSVLDTLMQFLDQDKILDLLDCYLRDSQQLIEQLEAALQDNNAPEARRMVHSLKSTSGNVGAMPLSALSKELEELASEEKLEDVRHRVDDLKQCFAATVDSIQQLDIMQARKAG